MDNGQIAKLREEGKSLRAISSVSGASHEAVRKNSGYFLYKTMLNHKEAVQQIIKKLAVEFGESEVIDTSATNQIRQFGLNWTMAVPDVVVKFKNGKFLIVEVGNTKPEKITFYLSREQAQEVRLYDRYLNMVGLWSKDSQQNKRAICLFALGSDLDFKLLKFENIIPEGTLREKLRLSKDIVTRLKKRGLPYLDFEGKIYFHEHLFVSWVLSNTLKVEEVIKEISTEAEKESKEDDDEDDEEEEE